MCCVYNIISNLQLLHHQQLLVSVMQDVYTADGVCPNDSLIFTCEVNDAFVMRVLLPSGYQEYASPGDRANDIALPAGFTADSLVLTPTDNFKNNITLTLSIENASLLNGGQITCDDTIYNRAMAGCPLAGESSA